jgi:LmbE family N-acetylglucosaminyl deacetylase
MLLALAGAAGPLVAQDAGPGTGGLARLAQDARYLDNWRRVLVIGAHPDDEDTELITILSRGEGIETAYLSLTRGEGGQNLIGGELGPGLGIVRSEELLAARRLDGGQQFFTRAFDFGFSKSPEETFRFWPRDSILKDVVRVIRRFRPHVIVSVWSGTARDGHGHHQASGLLAREAFDAAGDAARFTELAREEGLTAWQPAKLYRRWGVAVGEGLTLDGGRLDPAVGQSLHQIAMRSRSRHRSQDMGQLEDPGPSRTNVVLVAKHASVMQGPDTSLFAGIRPEAAEPSPRGDGVTLGRRALIGDAYTDVAEVVRGQVVTVQVVAWNAGAQPAWLGAVELVLPPGFVRAGDGDCPRGADVAPGAVVRCTIPLRVAEDAAPSQPYYLQQPLDGAMYRWDGMASALRGLPFAPPLRAVLTWRLEDGTSAAASVPVMSRALDQGLGEVRRPMAIVPRVALSIAPARFLWPAGVRRRTLEVGVEHTAGDSTDAEVRLVVPAGWQVSPSQRVRFVRAGERRVLTFEVSAPVDARGTATLAAEASVGRDTLRLAMQRIAYPHIAPHVLFTPAEAHVTVAPIAFAAGRRIGYVRGAADAIPEALAAAGMNVRLLDAAALDGAAFDSLQTIVIGPRAYEVDEAVRRAHPRLLRFVERGGSLVVQYQQYAFLAGGFAPLPFTIARPHDRVTDETAAVTLLDPAHALLRTPNRISAEDFTGWVQERGLYFAGTWDAAWTPLLAMADPGEDAKRGGLLVASLGRGTVVYTGLAFFRQLPAGVPGAWRLLANLLAIGGRP